MHPEDVLECTTFPALSKLVFIKYKYKYMTDITFGTNTIQKKHTKMHPEDVLGCTTFPALSKSVFIKYKYKYIICNTFGTNTIQRKDTNALRGGIRVHSFSGTEQASFYQIQIQYKNKYKCKLEDIFEKGSITKKEEEQKSPTHPPGRFFCSIFISNVPP